MGSGFVLQHLQFLYGVGFAVRESTLQNEYLCTSIWFLEGHLLTASLSAFGFCCPSSFILPLLPSTLFHFTPSLHTWFLFSRASKNICNIVSE